MYMEKGKDGKIGGERGEEWEEMWLKKKWNKIEC